MSNRDPREDMGLPYDPDTPEGFADMMRHHFDKWWNALDPPGSYQGASLEEDAARATWNAAGEYFWDHLEMVYDCMKGSADVWSQKALEEAGYLVKQLGSDAYSFKLNDFLDWQGEHGEHVRREYDDGTITITFRPKK